MIKKTSKSRYVAVCKSKGISANFEQWCWRQRWNSTLHATTKRISASKYLKFTYSSLHMKHKIIPYFLLSKLLYIKHSPHQHNFATSFGLNRISLRRSVFRRDCRLPKATEYAFFLASPADILRRASRVPSPRTSADLSGKKSRPITADFQIREVHFGPWEISRLTL